jgi:enoyl-CoA hydratase/carnithine racemase
MSEFSFITLLCEDGIATVTLNRPDRRNAINLAMYRELATAFDEAAHDTDVRALLITGANGFFTAGNDLSDFIGFKRDSSDFLPLTFLKAIESFPKPVVAAVERGAVGIGTTMLQYFDFVYAGASTRFSLPFATFGLCPEGGASRLLAHGAASRAAQRWLLLGEAFSAADALAAQLITEVVADGTTLAKAQTTATQLAAMNADALQTTKALIRAARPSMAQTFHDEGAQFMRLLESEFSQRAISAFANRK